MQLNYLFSNARFVDGYGRYNHYLCQALERLGVTVCPQHTEMANAVDWIQARAGLGWERLTISCLPPFYLNRVPGPGRHWLLTMTEGSALPRGWADTILKSGVERIIVPCEHNAVVFRETGLPVHVIPGGTDPDEFPYAPKTWGFDESYTFLSLADRGARKGWVEVWQAFYKAFGTPDQTPDVRLIIKSRPDGNDMLELIRNAERPDPRITILMEDMDMRAFYAMGDCFAIPSRCEGWGMPHREASCAGLPVIVQAHAGLDDGHTHEWALVVDGGHLEPIPGHFEHIAGQWMKADVGKLAGMMRMCYERPQVAARWGAAGAQWIRENQTWRHSAERLIALIGGYYGFDQ